LRRLFNRREKAGKVDSKLVEANAQSMWNGIKEGWQKDVDKLPYGSMEHRRLLQLRHNVHVTAIFKNYHNQIEMARELFDANGQIRSFNDFATAARPIAQIYNQNYLQAEYTTAIATSRNAAKWIGFEKKGGKLTYKTIGDGRVREEHRALDGITLSVGDAFWNTFYPPNG
jgi:hypothetical protein